MNSSQPYQPITIEEIYLSSLGFNIGHPGDPEIGQSTFSLPAEDHFARILHGWSGFCKDMAAWYSAAFSEEPIVLISAPTIEMCIRHQIPARRGFVVRTLGRIIEAMGPDSFVGIVDCKHDPITDPALDAQVNHWVYEFSSLGQIPYPAEYKPRRLNFSN